MDRIKMDYGRCKLCGEFGEMTRHQCPPMWDVWFEGDFDLAGTARIVHARDAARAAEEAFADYHEGEVVVEGLDVFVRPRFDQDAVVQHFYVEVEYVPEFTASRQASGVNDSVPHVHRHSYVRWALIAREVSERLSFISQALTH